jgi:hypothetical protein
MAYQAITSRDGIEVKGLVMGNHSIISHRANYYFIKLEEEYLAICNTGKAPTHCKAFILSILEHWMNHKRDKGQESLFVYMSYNQWSLSMYGMYARDKIMQSLEELLADNLIERRECKVGNQDSFEYRLNLEEIQKHINKLPEKKSYELLPIHRSKNRLVEKSMGVPVEKSTSAKQSHPSKNRRNIEAITEKPKDRETSFAQAQEKGSSSEETSLEEESKTTPHQFTSIEQGCITSWNACHDFPYSDEQIQEHAQGFIDFARLVEQYPDKVQVNDIQRIIDYLDELEYKGKYYYRGRVTPELVAKKAQEVLTALNKKPPKSSHNGNNRIPEAPLDTRLAQATLWRVMLWLDIIPDDMPPDIIEQNRNAEWDNMDLHIEQYAAEHHIAIPEKAQKIIAEHKAFIEPYRKALQERELALP